MQRKIRSTTDLCVRRNGKVVMAGDGQVTLGQEVLKSRRAKAPPAVQRQNLAGFAGSTADAFSLFARFEAKLEQYNGNLSRSVVELAKDWRTDKMLRHLEALLLVADSDNMYIVSGNGDVIEPDDGRRHRFRRPVRQIRGDGADGKHQSGRARNRRESHEDRRRICIYTNDNVIYEELA